MVHLQLKSMRRVGVVLFGLNDDMFLSIMTDQTFFHGASPIAVAGLLVTIDNQHQVPIFRGYCSDVVSTVLRTVLSHVVLAEGGELSKVS